MASGDQLPLGFMLSSSFYLGFRVCLCLFGERRDAALLHCLRRAQEISSFFKRKRNTHGKMDVSGVLYQRRRDNLTACDR